MREHMAKGSVGRNVQAVKRLVPRQVKDALIKFRSSDGSRDFRRSPSYAFLRNLMDRYRVERLVGETPDGFQRRIHQFLELEDAPMEGFQDAEKQRDLSIRFMWGHDHDFGPFRLAGQMGERHIWLLSTFMDDFRALPRDLVGKKVLDIGCWTGGTSLLLAAMGADVVAIEEVRKYVDALTYLRDSFGVSNLEPRRLSLYECSGPEFQDRFDLVLYAGVLYHVTDPVLSLRIVFDSLRDSGVCLLETAAIPSGNRSCATRALAYSVPAAPSRPTGAAGIGSSPPRPPFRG